MVLIFSTFLDIRTSKYLPLFVVQRTGNLSCLVRWKLNEDFLGIDGSGRGRSLNHQLIQDWLHLIDVTLHLLARWLIRAVFHLGDVASLVTFLKH